MKTEQIVKEVRKAKATMRYGILPRDIGDEIMIMLNPHVLHIMPMYLYKAYEKHLKTGDTLKKIDEMEQEQIDAMERFIADKRYTEAMRSGVEYGQFLTGDGKYISKTIELVEARGDEVSAWINEKFLKYFERPNFYIVKEDKEAPVMIKENGITVGFICPVLLREDIGIELYKAGCRIVGKEF